MLWVNFGPWFGFLAAHHESIWILGGEASWKLKEWAGLVSLRGVMRGVVPMLMKGISVLKGKEPRRLKCWEGYEYKRWEDRRAKYLLAFLRERIFCWWEEQRVGSIFWVESVEESYNVSVSGSHHQRTWIIFGGDSEVSMLNFFYLQVIFIVFVCFFFFLILFYFLWCEYCMPWVWIIKATHVCCWLVMNGWGLLLRMIVFLMC